MSLLKVPGSDPTNYFGENLGVRFEIRTFDRVPCQLKDNLKITNGVELPFQLFGAQLPPWRAFRRG
jgi:hypothetical protein